MQGSGRLGSVKKDTFGGDRFGCQRWVSRERHVECGCRVWVSLGDSRNGISWLSALVERCLRSEWFRSAGSESIVRTVVSAWNGKAG